MRRRRNCARASVERMESRRFLSAVASLTVTPSQSLAASTSNTGSFVLANKSTTALKITKAVIDISSAILPYQIWTPTTAGGDNFAKDITSDANGTTVGYSAHAFTKPLDGGYQSVELDFTNFSAGQSFSFSGDIDPSSIQGAVSPGPNNSGNVSGLELSGSTITITYSDGTVQTSQLFAQAGNQSGSQLISETGLPAAPSVSLFGVSTTPATLSEPSQSLLIKGPAGAAVQILDAEGGLYLTGVPGGGTDLHPYESNALVKAAVISATIGSNGSVFVPVTLTQTDSSSGFNYFQAVIQQSDGSTGATSSVLEVAYSPNASTPFSGTPIALPGTIMADNFDNGGQNVGYYDTSPGNAGGSYRNTDVDIEPTGDATPPGLLPNSPGVGFDIGHIVATEWLNFTVTAPTTGSYPLIMQFANDSSPFQFHVSVDGVNQTGSVTVPNTNGWQNWQGISAGNLSLSAGTHVLQEYIEGTPGLEVGNFEWLQLGTPTNPMETPFLGAPLAIPGTIMADNFDNGGQGVAYYDSTPGNQGGAYRNTDVDIEQATDSLPPGLTANSPGVGYDVGYITAGEWTRYSVNVSTTGTYNIGIRVADAGATGTFHLEMDGVNITGSLTFPVTGGWQTYTTVTVPNVYLDSGNHILRLTYDSTVAHELGNVQWMQFNQSANVIAPPTLNWTPIATAPEPDMEGSVAVDNGKAYFFSGFNDPAFLSDSQSKMYDPSTNTWTVLANMPEPLTHSQTAVDGNNIWLVGGFIGDELDQGSNHVWIYNTLTNTFTAGPNLPSPLGAAFVAIVGRSLHVISGLSETNGTFFNTTEHWVLNLDNVAAGWSNAAPIPRPRNHGAAIVYNNQIWVIGGQNVKDEFQGNSAAVDVYDPSTNTWSEPGDLSIPRGHILTASVILNGTIYLFGGVADGNGQPGNQVTLNTATAWNGTTHTWSIVPGYSLPAPRKSVYVVVAGNTLVAFGGSDPNPEDNGWSVPLTVTGAAPTVPAYLGTPFQINQTIQADNFDVGGDGVAFHNVEGSNATGLYRATPIYTEPTTDVPGPGETTSSPGEAFDIGHLAAGDWLDYAINVANTGTYSLDIRLASAASGGSFHLESDGTNISGPISFPVTGGWQTWATVTVPNISLTTGLHELRLVIDNSVTHEIGNINWFRIYTPGATAVPTAIIALPSPITIPNSAVTDPLKKKKSKSVLSST